MVEFCWDMFPLFMKDRTIGIARTVVNIATATIIIYIGRIHLTRNNNKVITIWKSKSSLCNSTYKLSKK